MTTWASRLVSGLRQAREERPARFPGKYHTSYINLAAFLGARGFALEMIPKRDRRFWFLFDDTEALQRAVASWEAREAIIDARRYSDTLDDLRVRCGKGHKVTP